MLYDASGAFEDETARKLRFDYQKMNYRPFHPAFLCGLYAEAPDVTDVVYLTAAETLAQDELGEAFSDHSGTTGHCPLPAVSAG